MGVKQSPARGRESRISGYVRRKLDNRSLDKILSLGAIVQGSLGRRLPTNFVAADSYCAASIIHPIQTEGRFMPKLQRLPEEHIEFAYGIFLLQDSHRLVKALKRRHQPSVHGTRTWGSAYLLMDYLQEHPPAKNRKVMELGCGWGATSVFCAQQFGSKVTAVDLDPAVFPFVDVFAEINSVSLTNKCADFSRLTGPFLGQHPLIIGGDICFWDNLVKPLKLLINRAIKNGTKRVVLTDPGRPPFYELCDQLSKTHQVTLQEWYAIEPDRFVGEVAEIRPRR